jgi:Tfp pilus assembly protein PilV
MAMRIKKLNNTGFSLLEILLAAIILVISVAGIFATLNAVRTPVVNKESSLSAALFGKQVLETLRTQVNAQSFYSACVSVVAGACQDFSLSLGAHQVPAGNMPAGLTWPPALIAKNTVCNASGCLVYTVSCGDNSAAPCTSDDVARRIDLNINW